MGKIIKRILASVLTVAMLITAAPLSGFAGLDLPNLADLFTLKADAAAYSGECGDNLTWSLDTETGVLTISGTGDMYDWSALASVPWYSNRSSIKTVVIGDSVTSIGDYAFSGCTSLTSVTIGNSVTSIGYEAFEHCTSLTSVTIGNSVTSIDNWAFEYCTGLTSITIPDSVTSIGNGAFYRCTGLTSVTIPDSVTSIGYGAFKYCKSLTSVTIPDSVTSIGNYAFDGCTRLTSVTIPDSVTSIGDYVFWGCTGLTSVTIPDSVTSIGSRAFEYCTSLTSVTIPDSVTSIGNSAFEDCYSLTSITIGNSVTSIGDYAFRSCTSLTSVTIPDSVTSIGEYAFVYCTSLTSVTIPDSVIRIYDYAFEDCTGLTDVYYTGSKEDWNKISIGSYNECLTNANIHFNLYNYSSKTISGTFESYVVGYLPTDDPTEENKTWISEVTIDGKEYNVNATVLPLNGLSLDYYDKYIGQKAVAKVENGYITQFKFVSDLSSKLTCTIAADKDNLNYTDGKYSDKEINLNININNCAYFDNAIGAGLEELDVYVESVTLTTSNQNLLTFNKGWWIFNGDGDAQITIPVNQTVHCGNSQSVFSLSDIPEISAKLDVNTSHKIPDDISSESATITCTVNATQNGKTVYGAGERTFTITNNDYYKPTSSNSASESAAKELDKAKLNGAITINDMDLNGSLSKLCTREQLNEIEDLLFCAVAVYQCPKKSFDEYLTDKIMSEVFGAKLDLGCYNGIIELKTYIKNSDYGKLEIVFTVDCTGFSLTGFDFGKIGYISYEVVGGSGMKKIPSEVAKSGSCGMVALANMTNFCNAVENVALSQLKKAYSLFRGNDLNKAVDVLFGKTFNEILSAAKKMGITSFGSAADIEWSILTSTKKHYKIKCPVDVYIYDNDGNLAASIIGDEITINDSNIEITLNGDIKNVTINNGRYTIEYVSTADGTLNIEVKEYANEDGLLRTVEINNVPLEVGVSYTQNSDDKFYNDSDYSLTSNSGETYDCSSDIDALHEHQIIGEWHESGNGYKYAICSVCNEWIIEPSDESGKVNSVSVDNIEMNYKKTATLNTVIDIDEGVDYTVEYSSSNPSVAKVDENGNVYGAKKGSADITVTVTDEFGNSVSDTCNVKVNYSFGQWLIVILLFGWIWY